MEADEPRHSMKPRNPGEALKVAETVLRRRNRDAEGVRKRAQARIQAKKASARDRTLNEIVTPEKLIKHARLRHADGLRLWQSQKQQLPKLRGGAVSPFFVVRNARRSPSRMSQQVLKSLNANRRFRGVFVPYTRENVQKLRSVEPYVFYGRLNDDSARLLFFKHLRLRKAGRDEDEDEGAGEGAGDDADREMQNINDVQQDQLVQDNVLIEAKFGHLGILCVEDLMEEILRCGTHCQSVAQRISPFKLCDIFKSEGVDAEAMLQGNIGVRINEKLACLV